MAFCENCGVRMPDGARFCVECGWQLPSDQVSDVISSAAQEVVSQTEPYAPLEGTAAGVSAYEQAAFEPEPLTAGGEDFAPAPAPVSAPAGPSAYEQAAFEPEPLTPAGVAPAVSAPAPAPVPAGQSAYEQAGYEPPAPQAAPQAAPQPSGQPYISPALRANTAPAPGFTSSVPANPAPPAPHANLTEEFIARRSRERGVEQQQKQYEAEQAKAAKEAKKAQKKGFKLPWQ